MGVARAAWQLLDLVGQPALPVQLCVWPAAASRGVLVQQWLPNLLLQPCAQRILEQQSSLMLMAGGA